MENIEPRLINEKILHEFLRKEFARQSNYSGNFYIYPDVIDICENVVRQYITKTFRDNKYVKLPCEPDIILL